jgi:hypothetical protein
MANTHWTTLHASPALWTDDLVKVAGGHWMWEALDCSGDPWGRPMASIGCHVADDDDDPIFTFSASYISIQIFIKNNSP